ncbi:MAG: histidinol-phosphate transaminase [Bryobacteraceae bacterium]
MSLVPPYIGSLAPYLPGLSIEEVQHEFNVARVVKLASNENPLGASPLAIEAIQSHLTGLNRYPNGGIDLRRVLAERYDVKIGNVIVGSGSEGIMSNILRTFLCDDDEVLTSEGTFAGFEVLARSRGVAMRTVPLKNWHFDLPGLAAAVNEKTKIVYLVNPNNPTGTIFTRQEFEAFYRHIPERVLIILDEAYFEYAKDNNRYPDSMHYRYDNVITLRTFSKAYGLAGARIGYGFAHEELIRNLMKVKLPFEPSTMAQAAGIGALADKQFLYRTLALNSRAISYLSGALRELGLTVLPSEANFVMVAMGSEEEAASLVQDFLCQGIILRHLKPFGLPNCIRISTGTDEQNRILVEALQERVQCLTPTTSSR